MQYSTVSRDKTEESQNAGLGRDVCNSECPTQPCGFAGTESQDSSCRNHKKRIVYEKSTDGPLLSNHFQCSRSSAILSCVEMLQGACLLDA